jgi:hypothetical protein
VTAHLCRLTEGFSRPEKLCAFPALIIATLLAGLKPQFVGLLKFPVPTAAAFALCVARTPRWPLEKSHVLRQVVL